MLCSVLDFLTCKGLNKWIPELIQKRKIAIIQKVFVNKVLVYIA